MSVALQAVDVVGLLVLLRDGAVDGEHFGIPLLQGGVQAFQLRDDSKRVVYDVGEYMRALPSYGLLQSPGLFRQVRLDQSRTCVYWNDEIDLPRDWLYEYGAEIAPDANGD